MKINLKRQLNDDGFVFLKKYVPNYSVVEISEEIGCVSKLPNVGMIQNLTPKDVSISDRNTYSGNFGLEEFPLHSDLAHWYEPPRYLVLRCVTGSSDVRTNILDGNCIISKIGELALARTLVIPRRPSFHNNCLLRLLTKADNGKDIFRWDDLFIKPANRFSEEVFGSVSRLVRSSDYKSFCLEFLGDTLILDNWRMLHGRSSVPKTSISRHVERVYLREIN